MILEKIFDFHKLFAKLMKILLFATLFYASAAFGEIAAWQRACKAGDTQACMEAGKYFTDILPYYATHV